MPHHALPYIGSTAWNREMVRAIGVRRSWVDEVIKRATRSGPASTRDPFDLWQDIASVGVEELRWERHLRVPAEAPGGPSDRELTAALELAAGVLLHQETPGYPFMMYLGHQLYRVGYESRIGRWFTWQLATMLARESPPVRDSAEYFLCMNVFWNPRDSQAVFPRLAAAMPRDKREYLLSLSSCVSWETKRAFYEKLARDPVHHLALARAMRDACAPGNLRSADALAFHELLARLIVPDPRLVAEIREAIGSPVRATVLALLIPGKGTPRPLGHPGEYLLRLDFHTPVAPWLIGAEMWLRKRPRGTFAAFRCYIEPDERATSAGYTALVSALEGYERHWREPAGPTSDQELVRWHAIEGPPGEAPELLGEEVEFWAPGMRSRRGAT
jgi:hypothetical protein